MKEIINNEITEIHLCKECFETRENEGGKPIAALSGATTDSFSLGAKKTGLRARTITCSICGTKEEDLRTNGRLGCGDCYKIFAEALEPIVSKVHGHSEHRGKTPSHISRNLDLKAEIRRLQEDLQNAVLAENYERAAKLRDKIKHFENIGVRKGTIEEPFKNV
jgi:protein arginine kinase activator